MADVLKQDCKERVALELMYQIDTKTIDGVTAEQRKTREYWLTLYEQCIDVVCRLDAKTALSKAQIK